MRAFLRWFVFAVGFTAGCALALVMVWPDALELASRLLHENATIRLAAAIIASLVLVSPLLMLLRWLQALRRSREISYTTDNGRISVNLIAIEEALTRAVEGEPEIKKARVSVYEDRVKRAIVIDAVVTLWEVANVTERNLFCQRLLRRRFAELMPERSDVQVNLAVHRLTIRPPPKGAGSISSAGQVPPPPVEPTPLGVPKLPTREPEHLPLSAEHQDEDDLYVGPTYPVGKDDEDEPTGVFAKPLPRRT